MLKYVYLNVASAVIIESGVSVVLKVNPESDTGNASLYDIRYIGLFAEDNIVTVASENCGKSPPLFATN
jgi:hypothetical protein